MERPRRGRPPGLTGREIGMYYKNMAQKHKRENAEKETFRLGQNLSVPEGVLANVEDHILKSRQKNEDERVSHEFESQFRHLLEISFEDFIAEGKRAKSGDLGGNDNLNQRLKSEMLSKESMEQFRQRYDERQKLPAMIQHEQILSAIKEYQVILIVGSTGCGKTTQVPQIILDDYIYSDRGSQCRIVCTQPRRISAISVAERVAYERNEKLGNSVGYQIRLESKMPREIGSILYCTTGIVLQKMQSDPLLNNVSFLFLDEIHERSVETDLLMALLQMILPYRPDLKVILMSATLSERDFYYYFQSCFTLRIEGTLYPVEVNYLEEILQETRFNKFQSCSRDSMKYGPMYNKHRVENERHFQYNALMEPYLRQIRDRYDAQVIQALRCPDSEGCENLTFIEFLIYYICENKPPGAILVFLPGYDKISKLNSLLNKPTMPLGQRWVHKIQVYPLHSLMPTVNQKSIFDRAPNGIRKVVLSTILAESSITIDDIVYVINTGRTKLTSYDVESNIQTLEETWVTKANTQQRKGRAGRVQPGICYNLFSRARENTMSDMPTPEILRCKLEAIILGLKLLHIKDVFKFMRTLLDPPNTAVIQNGLKLLKRIDALDENDVLTPLGVHLARLPIDPQIGKMILMAALFRCLDPITSVAAGLSYKSPFYTPLGLSKRVDAIKRDMSDFTKSDHLLVDKVLARYAESLNCVSERNFCYDHFLSPSTLQQLEKMKEQFKELLTKASFIEPTVNSKATNENSKNLTLVRAIIAAGLYPNMAYLYKSRRIKNQVMAIHSISTPEDRKIHFHPSSVNSGETNFDSKYFVYFQKQKSTKLYMLDSTMVFPMALIIFGDGVETGITPEKQYYISVAKAYYFKCDHRTANVILTLRHRLDLLMKKKALHPSPIAPDSNDYYLIKAIQMLLSLDDTDPDDYLTSSSD